MKPSARSISSCLACGKAGHFAQVVDSTPSLPDGAYFCPMGGPHPWGDTIRAHMGACGRCGGGNFRYLEVSRAGVRGYRCVMCGAVKPEPGVTYRVMVQAPDGSRPVEPGVPGRDVFDALKVLGSMRTMADKKGWNYIYSIEVMP